MEESWRCWPRGEKEGIREGQKARRDKRRERGGRGGGMQGKEHAGKVEKSMDGGGKLATAIEGRFEEEKGVNNNIGIEDRFEVVMGLGGMVTQHVAHGINAFDNNKVKSGAVTGLRATERREEQEGAREEMSLPLKQVD